MTRKLVHIIGFGCFWGWNFCLFWSNLIAAYPIGFYETGIFRVESLVTIVLALPVLSLLEGRSGLSDGRYALVVGFGIVAAMAGLLLYGSRSQSVELVLGVLIGICFAGLELLWSRQYRLIKQTDAWSTVIPASLVAGCGFFALAMVMPVEGGLIVGFLTPAVSAGALYALNRTESSLHAAPLEKRQSLSTALRILSGRFVISIGLYGLALGFVTESSLVGNGPLSSFNGVAFAVAGIALCAIMLLERAMSASTGFHLVHYILLPLISAGLVLSSFIAFPGFQHLAVIVIVVGFVFGELYFWAILAARAKLSGLTFGRVFGLGQAAKVLGLTGGMILSYALLSMPMDIRYDVAMVVQFALVIAALFTNNPLTVSFLEDKLVSTMESSLASQGDEGDLTSTLQDALMVKCGVITSRFGLSEREEEVLALLVQGSSIKAISEELFISENTTKSHTKHIYKKLSIHSRQELINLFRYEVGD